MHQQNMPERYLGIELTQDMKKTIRFISLFHVIYAFVALLVIIANVLMFVLYSTNMIFAIFSLMSIAIYVMLAKTSIRIARCMARAVVDKDGNELRCALVNGTKMAKYLVLMMMIGIGMSYVMMTVATPMPISM